ncbi:MAG: OmpA family protein [Burkholderiales bacterium]|nr:OmpA family protein [Burkholderiales bacterium]
MKKLVPIAALTAAALMSACVSQQTYDQQVQKTQAAQNAAATYQKLNAQLQGQVGADEAQIRQLENIVKVTLANAILFPEGGVKMHASGQALLARLAPVLKTLTGQKIEVKGFTDNVPIGHELRATYPTNVALSKARADDVANFLVAQGVPANIIVAVGLGDANPVASNDTAAGRAKNRRVEMDIVEAK